MHNSTRCSLPTLFSSVSKFWDPHPSCKLSGGWSSLLHLPNQESEFKKFKLFVKSLIRLSTYSRHICCRHYHGKQNNSMICWREDEGLPLSLMSVCSGAQHWSFTCANCLFVTAGVTTMLGSRTKIGEYRIYSYQC